MEHTYPSRKKLRLAEYDYSQAGYYFITFCTRGRECLLACIEPTSSDAPSHRLTAVGRSVERYILSIPSAHPNAAVEKYVIMPNHVHLILRLDQADGPRQHSATSRQISNMIAYIKRFSNRDAKKDLWQASFYDHIIRNEADFLRIWQYIDNNPIRWTEDQYYPSKS